LSRQRIGVFKVIPVPMSWQWPLGLDEASRDASE
jgi:hypothetical protein